MNKEYPFLYDDDDALAFIKNYLPEPVKSKFTDDDITYIVDLMYEFYESKGLLVGDDETVVEVDIDIDEMVAYILNNALSDGIGKFKAEDIELVVEGELEYCESIDMFE